MQKDEVFAILGIEETKDERALKNAYRQQLRHTNPEDDPEGFKRLRKAYEVACEYAQNEEEQPKEEEKDKDRLFNRCRCSGETGTGSTDCVGYSGIQAADKAEINLCRWTCHLYCR